MFLFVFGLFSAKAQIQHGGVPKLLSLDKLYCNSINTVKMPSFNLDSIKKEDAINDKVKGVFRFGFNHFVNVDLIAQATVLNTDTGSFYFTKIKSEDALSLNFAFNKFVFPKGSHLFIVAPNKTYLGSFNYLNQQSDSVLATDVLFTDEVIFEVFVPKTIELKNVKAQLFRITHGYRDFIEKTIKSLGDAGACNTNINCPDGDNWQLEKKSVACIIVNGNGKCTGTLLNNTSNDGTPYFLTANHCGAFNTNLWVFRFNYESTSCSNFPLTNAQSISGADVVSTNLNSDFALLKLSTTPPASYNVYYAGWDRGTTAPTECTSIHHPQGDLKKISFAGHGQANTYSSALCWQTGIWEKGNTEPGSSGCPLFNQNHNVVGQLYGGPSGCDVVSADKYDFFGRFDQSWDFGTTPDSQLKTWLDPTNTGATSIVGFAPSGVYSLTASLERLRGIDDNSVICSNNLSLSVFLVNDGNLEITNARINIFVDDVFFDYADYVGSLQRYWSVQRTLPTIKNLSNGAHKIKIVIESLNFSADFVFTESCSIEKQFTVSIEDNTVSVPYLETFQNSTTLGEWIVSSPNPFLNWERNAIVGAYGDNSGCFFADNYSSTQNSMGMSTYLYSPIFNFSNTTSNILLSFDVAHAPKNAARQDSLLVNLSTDCGATFKTIYRTGYTDLATANSTSNFYIPQADEWKTISLNLDEYAYVSNVQLLFENKSGWGNAIYLDNVRIDAVIGIDDNDLENDLQLYPNPASDIVIIKTKEKIESVKITNQLGQTVYSSNFTNSKTIDVSALKNGIYFVEVVQRKKSITKKLLITK
ncbi:MAG: T9SS type A sorting domain-containing protein [Bacteroidota bacterium]